MGFTACLLFTLISMVASSLALYNPENQPKRCTEAKTYGMLGYFCHSLNLGEVPKKMRSSIEVLELTNNRIRELSSESFSQCVDVKYIYLQYNIIMNVGKGTFTQLKKLEVLDLTDNGLRDVPGEIFELPLLRSLYLEKNSFDSQSFDKIPNPITAPLKKLNLANNRLDSIPKKIGILPDLNHLNISSNSMRDLTPQQFSPFCNLKEVDLNNTLMDKCRCIDVTDFLTGKRDIDIKTFYCKVNSGECQRTTAFNETQDYATCLSITRQTIADKEAKMTWGIVGLLVLSFMIIFIGILYIIHRRNVKHMRNRAKIHNNHSVIKVVETSPNSDDSTLSPENLLIRKSDV